MTTPQYEIENYSGTTVATVQPLEGNGVGNLSVPREIVEIQFSSNLFSAGDAVVIAGLYADRFVQGQSFTIQNSAYAGTYVVDDGEIIGDVVAVESDGKTYIPVAAGISTPSYDIVGVQPGANGVFHVENALNGHFTFLPSTGFDVAGNTLVAANISYVVANAETSSVYGVEDISVGDQTITITGDQTRFFEAGVGVRLRSTLNSIGELTYTILTVTLDLDSNTVLEVDSSVAIPLSTAVTVQSVLSRINQVTLVTVDGTIPLGTAADGTVTVSAPVVLTFDAPTTITSTATPTVSNVIYSVSGDHTVPLIAGTPILVKNALVDDERVTYQATVVSKTFVAPSISYPTGLTQIVTLYINSTATLPEIITDADSSLIFPVTTTPYGYLSYSVPHVDTSLQLVGRGASTFNADKSWGQALLENLVHVAENFAGEMPPTAPMVGQQWFDTTNPALRVMTQSAKTILSVVVGTKTFTVDSTMAEVGVVGDTLYVFNNNSYAQPTELTIATVSEANTPGTTSGFTTTVVVTETLSAGAETAKPTLFPYGQLFNAAVMKGVVVEGMPAIGDVDMGGYQIKELGDPTDGNDAVNLDFADTRYVNATGDTMTGNLVVQAANVTLTAGTLAMQGSSGIEFEAGGSGGINIVGSGSVTLASGDVDVVDGFVRVGSGSNKVTTTVNGVDAPAMTFVTTTALTTIGNAVIDLGGNKVVNSSSPTSAADLANKQYVDDRVNGIIWITPVLDPNLFDDSLSAPPSITPGETIITYHRTYIVQAPGTGDWAGFDGHAMQYTGTAWVSVIGRPVAIGDRFGVFVEPDDDDLLAALPAGGLAGQGGKIATIATVAPYTYTYYTPAEPDAISVRGTATGSSPHFGHSYTFRGTWGSGAYGTGYRWIEFAGPQMLVDGAGLRYTANILNIGQGTGVTVGADSVSLDTTYTNTLYLRLIGGTMTGAIAMGNNIISGLANATNPADAVNLQTADARYVNLAGDTMTGDLLLNGDPSTALGAVTKQYADGISTTLGTDKVSKAGDTMTGLLILSADPAVALGATTKQYVDAVDASLTASRVAKAGDTMTGLLILSGDPATALGAATKQYVDNNFVSRVTSTTLGAAINITLAGGGEVLGLPATPSVGGAAASKTYVDNQVSPKASDSLVVHLSGTESITGAKTFQNNVTVAADAVNNNLVITSTNFTVSGKVATSGAAYAIAMTSGQNNGGVGGSFNLAAGQGSTTGGAMSIASGSGTITGGNVSITSGTGASLNTAGSITLSAGNSSLLLDPRGVWNVGGLAPTGTRQAIVSDPSAPTTASPKWTNVATRVAAAPGSSAAPGVVGDWFADDNHFYVYGATGWRRVATSTF